ATLSKALSCYGVDCISANSTSDALAILAFSEPDAVICDLQMPGGGARRVLKRLKLQEHKPYFIVLSGHCPSGLVSELRELGADQILEKPIELDELIELLSRIIHEARSEKMKMAG
ncbi:MAG: response regulator, partial [Bdellovibrionales bacterium]|nr:response regulator [Bdellovibrionales bacterium]